MSTSMYRRARQEGAKRNPILANMARAALEVYCSDSALADYEKGATVPPCTVVQAMVEAYGTHDLVGEHIREHCPLMCEFAASAPSDLARAACGWALAFGNAPDIAQSFLAIARDGRISPGEIDTAQMVRAKAVEISRIMQEAITAIDNALRAGQKGNQP
ncbi:hypothetical protein LJC74_01145 [Eubacteriales bacterium OttesenSCG-928-A19]|nr:hypothetical protein [Eubacteriales bacterium OttesenSCG-928-A19]